MTRILEVRNLSVDFYDSGVHVNSALRDISFEVSAGETLGIVGETGCGKTLTGMAVMGLLPVTAVQTGSILLNGIGELTPEVMSQVRGSQMSVIFQNPQSAFNPVFTIGSQLRLVALKRGVKKSEVLDELQRRMVSVGLRDFKRVLSSYPHQLSGGMLQRCMIAMAILSSPKLLIADEPTTALDSTIGKQVLQLIKDLQNREGFAMIFISHDVKVVADISDKIAVLYAGKIVEQGLAKEVINDPFHPYTKGLLGAIPSAHKKRGELQAIRGNVPATTLGLIGCSFASRCPEYFHECDSEPPIRARGSRAIACWKVK